MEMGTYGIGPDALSDTNRNHSPSWHDAEGRSEPSNSDTDDERPLFVEPDDVDGWKTVDDELDDLWELDVVEASMQINLTDACSIIDYLGWMHTVAEAKLSGVDITTLRAFTMKIRHGWSRACWDDLPLAFPAENIDTLHFVKSRVKFLSAFEPVKYDCCRASCCCFVGAFSTLQRCPYCNADRRRANGTPYKTFTCLPLIPQLSALFDDPQLIKRMEYRHRYFSDSPTDDHDGGAIEGKVSDIFDGSYYRKLLKMEYQVPDQLRPTKFFSGKRDIALGLSSDGFAPFKKRKHSAWPLIIFNYNLPPSIRFHLENIICIGVIPGPKAVKDIDSFLVPLVDELVALERGVKTYDRLARDSFLLQAYLIKLFGDMPAMAKLMRMKGHNGLKPCRACKITGLRVPNSRATAHYVPLDRTRHPDCGNIPIYDPENLPKRTDKEIRSQAHSVDIAPNQSQAEKLSTEYGINGSSCLYRLKSLVYPGCMPHDFMHLIWENLIPNLVSLWTGNFKDLEHGDYKIDAKVWSTISRAAAESGATVPSQFGAKIPDFATRPSEMIAETWSSLTLHFAPILLHGKFANPRYYAHFCKLVKLLELCMSWAISDEEIDQLEQGFIRWVIEYEE